MIKAIIVDDEPLALDVLETYIAQLPELELVARCENALEAREVLKEHDVDLMFLDINMLGGSLDRFLNIFLAFFLISFFLRGGLSYSFLPVIRNFSEFGGEHSVQRHRIQCTILLGPTPLHRL